MVGIWPFLHRGFAPTFRSPMWLCPESAQSEATVAKHSFAEAMEESPIFGIKRAFFMRTACPRPSFASSHLASPVADPSVGSLGSPIICAHCWQLLASEPPLKKYCYG